MSNTLWQPGITLEELEKRVILEAMKLYHGKRAQVADVLGIASRTLDYKLAKYKADDEARAPVAGVRTC